MILLLLFSLVSLAGCILRQLRIVSQPFFSAAQLNSRIVGGTPISIESVPYQLSLQFNGSHRCGAVLISDTRALTAAHCTNGVSVDSLSIHGGSAILGSEGQVVDVERFIQNPNYNPYNQDYDVTVLHLATALALHDRVQPVSLAARQPQIGTSALASGWGALQEGGNVSNQLHGVNLPIVSQPICQFTHLLGITSRMLCAGYFTGGKDSCQGDSGGPLVAQGVLVGLVSWGYGCGRFASPGVYANVANLRNFIRDASGV